MSKLTKDNKIILECTRRDGSYILGIQQVTAQSQTEKYMSIKFNLKILNIGNKAGTRGDKLGV